MPPKKMFKPARRDTGERNSSLALLRVLTCATVCLMAISGSLSGASEYELTTSADADLDDADTTKVGHVRFETPRLQQLVEQALDDSATLRGLIGYLDASDVVAYVRCEPRLRNQTSGYLTFVSQAGGLRYVLIRVAYLGSRMTQVALVGHELQHAVEVADAKGIVDGESFHRAYKRMGYLNQFSSIDGLVAYETENARQVGERILRELQRSTE